MSKVVINATKEKEISFAKYQVERCDIKLQKLLLRERELEISIADAKRQLEGEKGRLVELTNK